MNLSIVATLYNSAPYIAEFHRRSSAAAQQLVGADYEIILVNDGSPDASLDLSVDLAASDPHVLVVDLSRNFGHHKAMMTGLAHATGELIFLIDSDLEEEPEWLLSFKQILDKDGSDVVYGVQASRKGAAYERVTGSLYYKLFRLFTGIDQPDNIVTTRLMTKRYVDALLRHQEREINIGALWLVTGFKQSQTAVKKHFTSPTTYSFSRKLDHFFNAVTSFSSKPLVFTFYAGLLISLAAAIYIVHLVARYFFFSAPPSGYTSIVASIWLLSGLIIFFLGVQGIYISKMFLEVKQRPYTIVRRVYHQSLMKEPMR